MTIVVNGETRDVPNGATLRSLIELMGLGTKACAAEVNRELVPKAEHPAKALNEGDQIELVTLIGGG